VPQPGQQRQRLGSKRVREGASGITDTGYQPAEDQTAPVAAIRILYTNAQSIFNKIGELNVTAAEEEQDLILLTQTWCGPHISNAELTVAGYQLEFDLRRDRSDTTAGIGGGLIVYSKIGLVLNSTNRFNNSKFNQFVEFEIVSESPAKFILVYRPPNSGPENIVELCNILRGAERNTVILGDFNLPEIGWKNGEAGARGRPILEAAMDSNLTQLVDFATHLKGNIWCSQIVRTGS
jgi:hypothetical protein